MNNLRGLLLILCVFGQLPLATAAGAYPTWHTKVSKRLGAYSFHYNDDQGAILIQEVKSGRFLNSLEEVMTPSGWLDFQDLNQDGYMDVVVYPPDYGIGSPLSRSSVYMFNSAIGQYQFAEIVSNIGVVQIANKRRCIDITNRISASKKPNYLTSRYCYNVRSQEWVHKADFYDRDLKF
jgi:hypothetical protein